MLLPFILSTIIFFCVAFVPDQSLTKGANLFNSYLLNEWKFLANNAIFFVLLFIVLSLIFQKSLTFEKKYRFMQKFLFSSLYVFTATIGGFISSLIFLFFVAFIQLNVSSILVNVNREIFGVVDSKKEILTILKSNNRPPEVIATDNNPHKELLAIVSATTGRSNYYGAYVMQSMPSFLTIPITQDVGILLIDNTLIVSKIDQDDIQILSPVVGNLLVRNYFPTRKIKAYPKISIVKRPEYIEYRKAENLEKLKKNQEDLEIARANFATISASLESNKNQLQQLQDSKPSKNAVEKITLDELNKKIASESTQLSEFKTQVELYETIKQLLDGIDYSKIHENGLFVPQDIIKIVYNTDNPHRIADYFATLTHEYLHYASFVSVEKTLNNSFFEEGFTEYFARRSIQEDLNTSTNLGYPIQAKIISEMTNLIPESEFADIYFSKDQEQLERTLNRVYGDNFYKDTKVNFESIQFINNPKEILKHANIIMKRIGAQPLSEKDLFSSYSKM